MSELAADARFPGVDPDLTRVTDEELGDLLAVACPLLADQKGNGPPTRIAHAVAAAARERSPLFSPSACLQLFAALADAAPEATFGQTVAVGALLRCTGPLPAGLADPAAILARQDSDGRRYVRLALAKLADDSVEADIAGQLRKQLAGDPLALAELDAVLILDAAGRAVVAEADRHPPRTLAPLPDIIDRLAAAPGYLTFARDALEAADARVADIQDGRAAYEADKAFTVAEADVLWRVCQVALLRDEPWLGDLLHRLLPGVTVAPTAARTAPSQSASIVLAQAVSAWPTPEAVGAVREAKRLVRHAGLAKKLDRLVRTAEQGLARRPTVALRLPGPGAPTRAQMTTLARALEAGFPLDTTYRYDRWQADLAGHPHLGDLTGRLVWDVQTRPGQWLAVLPVPVAGEHRPVLTDAVGEPVPTPEPQTAVRLWHPCRATAQERAAWRDRIVKLRLAQPFRQAFREHYIHSSYDMFAGHVVAITPLLGLATRQGWCGHHLDGVLHREFGPWRVELAVSGASLFPGASGFGDVGALHLHRRDGSQWSPASFADAPPVLVSEALRGVDLLVSVAGFGVEHDDGLRRDDRRWELLSRLAGRPLSETGRMRRAALERVLAGLPPGAGIRFGPHHVHVGPYAVHLDTARVTRDGDPVTVDPPGTAPAVAVPWLPYDEHLLERITHTVVNLAGDRDRLR